MNAHIHEKMTKHMKIDMSGSTFLKNGNGMSFWRTFMFD